jgi:hypothetical protein
LAEEILGKQDKAPNDEGAVLFMPLVLEGVLAVDV